MARKLKITIGFCIGMIAGVAVAWPKNIDTTEYVAWSVSTIYHVAGCRYGPMIERFTSEAAAKAKGLKPCPHCQRDRSQQPPITNAASRTPSAK